MNTKYNPALSSMVRNLRDLAKSNNLDTAKLSNEQVFRLFDDNSGYATNEEDEQAFLEALKQQQ